MRIQDQDGLGTVEVRTIPTPEGIFGIRPSYTYSGSVLLLYKTAEDPTQTYVNVGVIEDDGSHFRKIFGGEYCEDARSNGIRNLPFADNKRVLLGNAILECTPDIDHCQRAELIPIEYPVVLDPADMWMLWSEPIISPDNVHIAWTYLHNKLGSLNFIGVLKRGLSAYTIADVQLISTLKRFEKNPDNPEELIPLPMRGGELKQFVRGGNAVSLAGSSRAATGDSAIQDLDSDRVREITLTTGYDETTMVSPDGKLGMVMTSRFSPKTDTRVLALLPRPYGMLMTMGLTMPIYTYSCHGARNYRKSNMGPALVELDKATRDPRYRGVCLADPEENWIFCSPLSWHPNGKRAMWPEMLRGTSPRKQRIQIVELLDYQPMETVPVASFPERIPYAVPLERITDAVDQANGNYCGKIIGKSEGYIDYKCRSGANSVTEAVYHHFSDDGKTWWDGYERTQSAGRGACKYEAKVEKTGEMPGRMDLRAKFDNVPGFKTTTKLDFAPAADGLPATGGFATYNGETLRVEDLMA